MKILILQPNLESRLTQLETALKQQPLVDMVLFPEGYLNENAEVACGLAKKYRTALVGGHRRFSETPKDRAILINREGAVMIDRPKYSETLFARQDELVIGHILCDELVIQGIKSNHHVQVDVLVHPIGVGMFSDEQFEEWIDAAKKLAVAHSAFVVGTSHADGTFRYSSTSIPIAYGISPSGDPLFVCKNEVQSVILDTETNLVKMV